MAASKVNHKNKENETNMKGTFVSLGVVFGVILFTYFVMYGLYLARI